MSLIRIRIGLLDAETFHLRRQKGWVIRQIHLLFLCNNVRLLSDHLSTCLECHALDRLWVLLLLLINRKLVLNALRSFSFLLTTLLTKRDLV